jgi:hypothetical protein
MHTKTIAISIFSILFSLNALAQDRLACIDLSDMNEIGQSFPQINRQIRDQKPEYCEADLGKEWFAISKSLEVLKNTQPDEPSLDQDDAFTFKAISENNWWAYFTNRAGSFTIEGSCQTGVVAFVFGGFGGGNGNIHICPLFFEQNISSQASVMMHEVRHFDGFRHVTCTRGQEEGNRGACDTEITRKGSYAISVQTLVGLARSKQTSKTESALLESEAMYMAFNKFNKIPKVKVENSIILSNQSGEVYKWVPNEEAVQVGQLNEAATVLNSSGKFTIYPTDTNLPAYRMGKNLEERTQSIGLFAEFYNKETPSEKAKYSSVSYFGGGGLLKGNTLITICDNQSLFEKNLDSEGDFSRIISLSTDQFDVERKSFLLSKKGELIAYSCKDNQSNNLVFQNTGVKIGESAQNLAHSFGLAGRQYAVSTTGNLVLVTLNGNSLISESLNMPIANKDWVSATPFSTPEIFN